MLWERFLLENWSYTNPAEVCMNNNVPLQFFRGRVGLYAILRALGISSGDDVLLQAFTCIAVPEAILAVGARPVWADIAANAVNSGINNVKAAITPTTKAVIVQHTFGIPSDIDQMAGLCRSLGIPLIEDCCHVGHTHVAGRPLGSFGVASFWSYEWGKPIVAGVGGAVVANEDSLKSALTQLYSKEFTSPSTPTEVRLAIQRRIHAAMYSPRTYWSLRSMFRRTSNMGIVTGNYNSINTCKLAPDYHWRAARGTSKAIPKAVTLYENSLTRLHSICERYRSEIRSPDVAIVGVPEEFDGVPVRFPLFAKRKTELLCKARQHNLEIAGWYETPVHPLAKEQDLQLVNYIKGACPNAERASRQIVSLPLNPKCDEQFTTEMIALINNH
jgi:perosamine synthetase